MTSTATADSHALRRTRSAFMWMKFLDTPFWSIFNMLPFILFRDLHATPLQITALIVLKPAVSLISIYWSALIEKRKDRLISNLIWARVLSHTPFLFFPFFDSPWAFIASFGFFMMLARGTIPAWMEVLKINMPVESRLNTFAYGSAFAYFGSGVLPFALGWMLDTYPGSWRWIFVVSTLISMGAILFKSRIPITLTQDDHDNRSNAKKKPFLEQLINPWKKAWELLKEQSEFYRYQIGYFIGGAGLIIAQPALPAYMMDQLNISYTDLAVALTLFKGIGFAVTSPAWAKLLSKIDIFKFNMWVSLLATLFPLFLIAAQINLMWLFVGYLLYGSMQGGSELSWNLSGPHFAKHEDSSVYSNINILTVGIRGCIIPIIGSLLLQVTTPTAILLFGAAISLVSAGYMERCSRQMQGLEAERIT